MRILVTGASGLLGLNVALEAAHAHDVFGQTHTHELHTEAFKVLSADLRQPGAAQSLLDQSQPDWVIHCAALANVDACENDPQQAHQLNTEVPAQLAQLVARGGARFVHISTDAVFDGQSGHYSETDAPNPLGVYAKSKLAGERAVAQANPQAIIARVNLFGFSLSGKRSLAEFFINNLADARPVMGFTDVFFCPLLVNHLAHILLKMLAQGLSGLYHVVSSECTSKYAFGVALARQFGMDEQLISPASVQDAGLKAARSPNLTLRVDKLERALGESLPSLSPGIRQLYTLYQQGYPQRIKQMG